MRSYIYFFGVFLCVFTLPAATQMLVSEEVGAADLNCGFTDDFTSFLSNNGYNVWQFDRPDLKCGAYGGKATNKEKLKNIPIIFLHGNSDVGFGRGTQDGYASWQTGFRQLATYLAGQGYSKSQMYTTTWGTANPNLASQNYHSKKNVIYLRTFVEAVLAYTNAKEVNIIGHSMGVTYGRRIIKGGSATDHIQGSYVIGNSLKDKVKSFIGLAGANLGLNQCYGTQALPTCGTVDGFYPGLTPASGPSKFLSELNNGGGSEGNNTYTIWSKFDDLILSECLVWGKVTCRIYGQQAEVVKTTADWGHFAVRDKTGPDLIKWL